MEVADLVQATLEKNGTFSLLKAQLRASVQRVIQGDEKPTANTAVARLAGTEDGERTLLLIREALECLGLEQTLATISAECGSHMPEMEREPADLARKLNVTCVAGEPVLLSVVRGRSEGGKVVAHEPPSPPLRESKDADDEAMERTRQSGGGARVVNVHSADPVESEPEPEPVVSATQAKVARLGQGAITRSTAGWDVKADDYTDDFLDEDSTAGPETHHGGDSALADEKTKAVTDGMKVSDWDASDDFDSSLDGGRQGALLPSGSGLSKLPSLDKAEVNAPSGGGSKNGWGTTDPVNPISAGSSDPHDGDSSGYSIEEALSDHPEEKADADASRDSDFDNSYLQSKSADAAVLRAAGVVEKRSNQEDDSYGNDFSMESAEQGSVVEEKHSEKADDDYEADDYEQDFEFEEDTSSFHVDAKNEDKSMSSDGSSVFGARAQETDADESARLEEVNRKLAALEEADVSLKELKELPNAKPANDFEVDGYDSIDEILSDSVSSDDGLSVGGADSASDSFLNESDSRGFMADSRGSATAKSKQGGSGRAANTSSNNSLASSIEFSVTEHEVSGSNAGLDDVDFSARALPPVRGKRSGW